MKTNDKILITGGAGYIGSKLATYFVHNGFQVTVVDHLEYGIQAISHLLGENNFCFIRGDVRDKSLMKELIGNANIIIPLAALVGGPLCADRPNEAREINETAILEMCEILNEKQRVLYLNTNSGYGVGYKSDLYDETSPLNPSSVYGITKKKAEDVLLQRSNTISFRLASVFGCSFRERDDLLLHFFVKKSVENSIIEVYQPTYKRNFIHINDVVHASAFVLSNFAQAKGNIYNLTINDENISKLKLAKLIAEHNANVTITEIEGIVDLDQRNYVVSSEKIQKLGYQTKYKVSDGIKEMSMFYKNKK